MAQKGRFAALLMHSRSQSSQPLLPSPLAEQEWLDSPPNPKVVGTISRRRLVAIVGPLLVLLSVGALAFSYVRTGYQRLRVVNERCPTTSNTSLPVDEEQYVLGPPTDRFRDNLRNDTRYITSWVSAGWTNDVMTYANLVYLGLITDRVPVIPPFVPSHIGSDVPPIAFGEVFDVPRLRQAVGPIVEWHELKNPESSQLEDIGCWNIWQAVQFDADSPRYSVVPSWLNLDISYTRAPDWVKMFPQFENDPHASFWSLATLAFSEARAANLVDARPSPEHHASLEPDEHLACYDYLYYTSVHQPYEWETDYAPQWREVATHFRWNPRLQDIADYYLRVTFDIPDDEDLPPYIAIHARHGDFGVYCEDRPKADCFAPLSAFSTRVQEIQQELLERKGIEVSRVVVTSDETDTAWWDDVAALGWYRLDHDALQTVETYSKWYPVLVDAVVQSSGQGFVGTAASTMSVLARRRVEDWHRGFTRTVRWGTPDADSH